MNTLQDKARDTQLGVSRRGFLKTTALAGGGIAIGLNLSGCADKSALPHADADSLQPNAFIQLNADGELVLQLHKVEMGQGVYPGMLTLVAEELNVAPGQIRVEQAQVHADFVDPEYRMQMTGGSNSLRVNYLPLREAAASLHSLLLSAAAEVLAVPVSQLQSRDGVISDGQQSLPFAKLLSLAKTLPLPEEVNLKADSEFRFIGKASVREDALAKVTGTAQYGVDVPLEEHALGAATAVLRRCPHLGGVAKSWDASVAENMAGVRKIIAAAGGVAVLADGYWSARQAADALDIHWSKGPLAGLDSEAIYAEQSKLLEGEGKSVSEAGDAEQFSGGSLRAEYRAPFLAHAAMEPLSVTVKISPDRVDLWCGNQTPDAAVKLVAELLDRPKETVHLHNQMLGGGFGRRLLPDYVVEAAAIAQAAGEPVKVMWSREDDMQHGFYRPAATAQFEAKFDGGKLSGMHAKLSTPSLMRSTAPHFLKAMMPSWLPNAMIRGLGNLAAGADTTCTEGISDSDYQFSYKQVEFMHQELDVPVSFWRSVGHSQNAFFMESFIDEMAHTAGQDPVDFRLGLLPTESKRRKVLEQAAKLADWGNAPAGQFQGVAVHESFSTPVAQVVNASVRNGRIHIHKVVCVVDCGLAVNPDVVRGQMEGGIIYGLSAALQGEITLQDGAVQQSNFHDYAPLRMNETPDIEVHILASTAAPTGVGEPGVPPIAPALANAVFAASGQRLRSLPLQLV